MVGFFFALPLGGVLFCELFELLFFLLVDAVEFTLIEHVSRVEGAVVGVVFAQVGCLHHREVLDMEWDVLCVSASAFSCSSRCVGSEHAVTAGLVWWVSVFCQSWSRKLIC